MFKKRQEKIIIVLLLIIITSIGELYYAEYKSNNKDAIKVYPVPLMDNEGNTIEQLENTTYILDAPPLKIATESINSSRLISKDFFYTDFNETPISASEHSAHKIQFNENLKVHQCWCYAIKVTSYNPQIEISNLIASDIEVFQNSTTKDLTFTDNINFISFYDNEADLTFSIMRDGYRAIRTKEYSIYITQEGQINKVLINDGGSFKLTSAWGVPDVDYNENEVAQILSKDNKYTSYLLTRGFRLGRPEERSNLDEEIKISGN